MNAKELEKDGSAMLILVLLHAISVETTESMELKNAMTETKKRTMVVMKTVKLRPAGHVQMT